MARRSSRTRRANGLFSRAVSPVRHAFQFGDDAVGRVTGVARNVVGSTIRGVDGVVGNLGRHANQAASNLFVGKRKSKSRKGGASTRRNRKTRTNTRRNRRSNRK